MPIYPQHTRTMICQRADGSEIRRQPVSVCARMSMQAASDHRAADKAKIALGDELDTVAFEGRGMRIVLAFDASNRSYHKEATK